ncbi:hypothetical protein PENPOL_c014G02440 [Penicillium polonicum]|uniref:F-box domain-containing protein n=1 Tax=Penicillium polonicum TaxID=60169 RepID=A0A1V6NBS4_PENPO|nr:hypothetical protein PENPOL_c014G02440 [Penicillium polonicum]
MSFLTLPLEIHQRVISCLLSNRDVAALSVQCRTLHSLCDMATRKKYHRISVSSGEEDIDKPFALLMDILKRPSLGNYVRHVECCTATSSHMDYKQVKYQRNLRNEEIDLVQKAVKKGGFTGLQVDRVVNMLMQRMEKTATYGGYRHRESLGTFITQALTAILIVVSPNVVSMALTHPSGLSCNRTIDFPLAQLLRQVNASPENKPYLCHLRSVYVINKNDSTWSDGRFYLPMDFSGCLRLFDNLPSIESARVDIMKQDANEKLEFKEKCSNISKISIHHSSVGSLYLANLIWSCKILKEFQYSIGGRGSNDGGSPIFNPEAFLRVLCAHKKTLEILDVDTENEIDIFEIVDEQERDYQSINMEAPLNQTSATKHKGENEEHDQQMDVLMEFYKSGSSQLKELKGIDELIPNAEVVHDPDNDDHLLWSLEELGYESD